MKEVPGGIEEQRTMPQTPRKVFIEAHEAARFRITFSKRCTSWRKQDEIPFASNLPLSRWLTPYGTARASCERHTRR